jgi:protein Mpv17
MGAMPLMLAALAFSPQAVRERQAGAGLVSHPSPSTGRIHIAPAAVVYAPAMYSHSLELPLSRLFGISVERLRAWWDGISPATLSTVAVVSAAAVGGDLRALPATSNRTFRASASLSVGLRATVSQFYEGSLAAAGWNAERTLRFLFVRVCVNAPLYSTWLRWLEQITGSTPCKLALDCFVYTPMWHLLFFTSMTVISGAATFEPALRQTLHKMCTSLPASWSFWLPVQLVTFSMCPLQYRLMFVSVISFVWNAILSTLASAA